MYMILSDSWHGNFLFPLKMTRVIFEPIPPCRFFVSSHPFSALLIMASSAPSYSKFPVTPRAGKFSLSRICSSFHLLR